MKPYDFKLLHREKEDIQHLICRDTYRFKTRLDRVYFIEVERYNNNLYVLKFYLRIHRYMKDRYKRIINDGDGFRILSTCLALAAEINENDKNTSFGFIGENCEGEDKFRTKRYRIYQRLAIRYFSPEAYNHYRDENNSIYFLFNIDNKKLTKNQVTAYLNENYDLIINTDNN